MAYVTITIKDIDIHNIGVDIGGNSFPENTLLYTNAQMLARDILNILQQMAGQINSKKAQEAVHHIIGNHAG